MPARIGLRARTGTPLAVFALRGSALFAAMRIGGAGIGFVTQVVLANILGAHDLGVFFSATSLATVAGLVAAQGYPQIAARFAARYRDEHKRKLFAAFVAQSSRDGLTGALAATAVIVALSFAVPQVDLSTRLSYAIAGLSVLATACLTIYTNLAGAMRLFGLCYVPEGLIRPTAFLILIGALALFGASPSAAGVTGLFALLTGVIAVGQFCAMRGFLPASTPLSPGRQHRQLAWRWRKEAWPLMLLSLYTNIFADLGILFATPFLASADVAVFGLCLKLALLVGYVVQITQQMTVPDIADARRSGDVEAMRRIVQRSAVLPALITLAAMAASALFGDTLLACFGEEFRGGRETLVILVASQVVRALGGPSAHVLTLTGAQGLNARLCAGALIILFAANLLVAPVLGSPGAAWAVVLSYGFWIVATALALRRLGEIRTDVLAVLPTSFAPATTLRDRSEREHLKT